MLADSTSNSYSTNTPQFTSSVKIESLYEEILIAVIPFFINTFSQKFNKEVLSETDLSQNFGIVLDRYIKSNDKIRLCIRENTKDIYSSEANNKKMPDFSFYSLSLWLSETLLFLLPVILSCWEEHRWTVSQSNI